MNLSEIAFLKGGIYIPYKKETKEKSICPEVIMFNYELLKLGYTLRKEDMYFLDEASIRTHGKDMLSYVYSNFLGNKETWAPFHKGFPYSVISTSEAELYEMQMRHYIEGWEPEIKEEDKIHISQKERNMYEFAEILNLLTEKDIIDIYKRMLGLNQSIPLSEKAAISYLLKEGKDIIPDKIPFKENLALVVSVLGVASIKYCSSINDILRGIMYSLNMPVTLQLPPKKIKNGWGRKIENPERCAYKFPSISRQKRREFFELIDSYIKTKNVEISDIKKTKSFWIKLAERLHPNDFYANYPWACGLFFDIRDTKLRGFYSELHEAYKVGQDKVLEVLSKRPGEFFRRFDSLYRRNGFSKTKTLNALVDLEKNPSTKVILDFLEYFSGRNRSTLRSVKVPGSRDRFALPTLEPLRDIDITEIKNYSLVLLQENYEKQESLEGKTVVISENLKDVRLPKDMRSMSESLKIISRGTAIDIPKDINYLRMYSYWKDPEGSLDLDLTSSFLNELFECIGHVSWNTTLKFKDFAVHSGDVRNRKGNCAEYVDIDVEKAIKMGVRWVTIEVEDYTGEGFHKYENSSGICAVNELVSSLDWYPSEKVLQSFKLNTTGSSVLAFAVDLVERKLYFLDENLKGLPIGTYNLKAKTDLLRSLVEEPFVSVLDLLRINANARKANIITSEEFEKMDIENLNLENYIFYNKENILKDISLLKDILE